MNIDIDFQGIVLKKKWKLIKKNDSGSFGVVYMAKDLITKKIVAVKIEENNKREKLKNENKIIL